MSFSQFLRDQWRMVVSYLLGIGLVILLSALYIKARHVTFPPSLLLYGIGLGLFPLLVYLLIEYLLRRPFYQGVRARLQSEGQLEEAVTLHAARTQEQRLMQSLVHHYYYSYELALRRLEEQRNFYEMFVTRFAHQMKTPLTVVQLLEGELRNEGQAVVADSLHEERVRLDQSLNMMLQTARLHEFAFDSRMESVALLHLLRQVINEHKAEWIRYRLFPKIICERDEVYVQTDAKWFALICEQIVRNALQYGSKTVDGQRVPSSFSIEVHVGDSHVELRFVDVGIGIPAQDLRYVFQPFYTGANGRTHSRATGIGLYLVKEASERLGHHVSIQSVEGEGTKVLLRLARPGYYEVAMDRF